MPEEGALISKRLFLRPPRPGDAPAVEAAVAESLASLDLRFGFSAWRTAWGHEAEGQSLTYTLAQLCPYAPPNVPFHLFTRKGGAFVGAAGVHSLLPRPRTTGPFCAELWCWVRDGEQKKGYGRDAVSVLTSFVFNGLGCIEAWITHARGHEAAARLTLALGFELVGRRNDYAAEKGLLAAPFGLPPNRPLYVRRQAVAKENLP